MGHARLKILLSVLALVTATSMVFHLVRWHQKATVSIAASGSIPSVESTIRDMENLLQSRPEDSATRESLARLYFTQGDFRRSIGHLSQLHVRSPRRPSLLIRLAIAHMQLGESAQALRCIQRALKLDPRNMLARDWLGRIYLEQGLSDEALATFTRMLQQEPTNYTALIGQTRALEQQYEAERPVAIRAIIAPTEKAVSLQPKNPEAIMLLSRMVFAYLNQFDRSEKLARRAMALAPNHPYPYMITTEVYLSRPSPARLRRAEAYARMAVRLDPDNAEPLNLLGRVLWRRNQVPEAISALEKSLEIRSMPQSVYLLSQAYQRVGDQKKARQFTESYNEWQRFTERRKTLIAHLQHRPQDPVVYCDLAELYLSTGAKEPATNWVRKAQKIAPHLARVKELLNRIQEAQTRPAPQATGFSHRE